MFSSQAAPVAGRAPVVLEPVALANAVTKAQAARTATMPQVGQCQPRRLDFFKGSKGR